MIKVVHDGRLSAINTLFRLAIMAPTIMRTIKVSEMSFDVQLLSNSGICSCTNAKQLTIMTAAHRLTSTSARTTKIAPRMLSSDIMR